MASSRAGGGEQESRPGVKHGGGSSSGPISNDHSGIKLKYWPLQHERLAMRSTSCKVGDECGNGKHGSGRGLGQRELRRGEREASAVGEHCSGSLGHQLVGSMERQNIAGRALERGVQWVSSRRQLPEGGGEHSW
ncbi:unnamed protein product [Calypogeia fissa]